MLRPFFSLEDLFEFKGAIHTVRKRHHGGSKITATYAGGVRTFELEHLMSSLADGKLTFVRHADDSHYQGAVEGRLVSESSPAAQALYRRVARYVLRFSEEGREIRRDEATTARIRELAREFDDPKPPCAATLRRWAKRYREAGGDETVMLGDLVRRGCGRRAPEPLLDIYEEAIAAGKTKQRSGNINATTVYHAMTHRVREYNARATARGGALLRAPSLSTVRRWVDEDLAQARMRRELGAEKAHRLATGSGVGRALEHALQEVEIDHTVLDYIAIDAEGRTMGRPTITFGICRHTRMPWGVNIGFGGPSLSAVLRCLVHGVLPKNYVSAVTMRREWPVFGVPGTLRCDNGREFHSASLRDAARMLRFNLAYCPRKAPNHKGAIERALKELNYGYVHGLPGTCMAKWWKKPPQSVPLIRFDDLTAGVIRWIVDVYSTKFHRSLRTSPVAFWNGLVEGDR